MKLASLKEFGETYYTDGSRPSLPRLRRMAKRGDIPAVRQGTRWYVDIDRLDFDENDPDALLRRILRA